MGDNCLVFVYEGGCSMCGQRFAHHDTACFDAADPSRRKLILATRKQGVGMMILSGKRINEPIAWHGPFVMNTKAELRKGFADYQAGKFPYERCSFDYREAKGGWSQVAPAQSDGVMRCIFAKKSGIAYPFGDDFSVVQPFPTAISAEDADPFLM